MSTTTTTSESSSRVHDAARNRLATLTAHLLPSTATSAALLQPIRLSASSGISPPANLKGTLTVVDDRTGKKYQIDVSPDGTVKSNDFKKVLILFFLLCWLDFQFGHLVHDQLYLFSYSVESIAYFWISVCCLLRFGDVVCRWIFNSELCTRRDF